MEGPVSSADPLASSLGIPSAVCRKMKGSGLWQIKITSATTEVSVQKHFFAEIYVFHLSGCSRNDSPNRDHSVSIWMMKYDHSQLQSSYLVHLSPHLISQQWRTPGNMLLLRTPKLKQTTE